MRERAWADPWIADVGSAIARLRHAASDSGGPPPEALDLTGESLRPLWAWARHRFVRRAPDVPVGDVPGWYGDVWEPSWWDDPSIWLADGLAAYYGEVLRSTMPDARWDLGHDEQYPDHYLNEGEPAVEVRGGHQYPPFMYLTTMCGRVWSGTATDDDLHDLWSAQLAGLLSVLEGPGSPDGQIATGPEASEAETRPVQSGRTGTRWFGRRRRKD